MTAAIHTLARPARAPALRVALLPGSGAHVEALVRAYLPASVEVTVGAAGADDLAVVWWDGPAGSGLPVLEVPLIALCAGGPDVLAAALEAGADHALALPVTADLLRAARLACTRRWSASAAAPAPPTGRSAPAVLRLDRRAHTVEVHGHPVHLTLREFDLLGYLVSQAGAACTRDEMLEHVWGIDFETGTNTVDVFVYALRRKLRAAGLSSPIETVRGVGYRLAPGLI